MINTECGEMEELRLDDWVKNEFGWVGRVIQINDDGEFFVESDQCSDDHIWTDVDCTLLHRPFEYGDIVIETDLYDRTSEVVEWGYYQQSTWDFQNEPYGTNETHFEHKKESWRDHSEWSGA